MTAESDQRAYVIRVMARTGWNQTDLAQRAGLDPSTLSRFLSGHRPGRALRASTIRKIEAITGIAFTGGDEPAGPAGSGFAEAEAEPLAVPSQGPLQEIVAALSRGRVNIDPWTLKSRALDGAGFRPGDILLVALGETPVAGDVVCAQIYDWAKGKAETVFRLFQPPYLVAATSEAGLLRPFVVDDSRVIVKGVVVNAIRGRTGS
jgi:transcriptional regulator with XRE-family HTH domain